MHSFAWPNRREGGVTTTCSNSRHRRVQQRRRGPTRLLLPGLRLFTEHHIPEPGAKRADEIGRRDVLCTQRQVRQYGAAGHTGSPPTTPSDSPPTGRFCLKQVCSARKCCQIAVFYPELRPGRAFASPPGGCRLICVPLYSTPRKTPANTGVQHAAESGSSPRSPRPRGRQSENFADTGTSAVPVLRDVPPLLGTARLRPPGANLSRTVSSRLR